MSTYCMLTRRLMGAIQTSSYVVYKLFSAGIILVKFRSKVCRYRSYNWNSYTPIQMGMQFNSHLKLYFFVTISLRNLHCSLKLWLKFQSLPCKEFLLIHEMLSKIWILRMNSLKYQKILRNIVFLLNETTLSSLQIELHVFRAFIFFPFPKIKWSL